MSSFDDNLQKEMTMKNEHNIDCSQQKPSPRDIVVGILTDVMLKLLMERTDGRKRRSRCQSFSPPSKCSAEIRPVVIQI
jgi:hypothetical protein